MDTETNTDVRSDKSAAQHRLAGSSTAKRESEPRVAPPDPRQAFPDALLC